MVEAGEMRGWRGRGKRTRCDGDRVRLCLTLHLVRELCPLCLYEFCNVEDRTMQVGCGSLEQHKIVLTDSTPHATRGIGFLPTSCLLTKLPLVYTNQTNNIKHSGHEKPRLDVRTFLWAAKVNVRANTYGQFHQ